MILPRVHSKLRLKQLPILLFIILVISGSIPLKVLAIVIYPLLFPSRVFVNIKHRIALFYLGLFVLTFLLGLPYLLRPNYMYGYAISLVNISISFLTFSIIYSYISNQSGATNKQLLDSIFYILVLFTLIQYFVIALNAGTLNIYSVSNATGDFITSIFSNSSVNMVVMSFFFIFYVFYKEWSKAVMAFIVILLTGYMSGIVLMLGALGIWYFTTLKITKIHLIVGLLAIVSVLIFPYISKGNYDYVLNYLKQITSTDPPYKIVSYFETLNYWTSSIKSFFLGAGPNNFSSRTAFVLSGDYVNWYPENHIYISNEFYANHFGIWIHDFMNPYNNRNNMANQPFSFYNRIIGDFGLIGIILYITTYFSFFLRHSIKHPLIKLMFIFFSLLLLTDYWFEYLSVVIVFEMITLIIIQKLISVTK